MEAERDIERMAHAQEEAVNDEMIALDERSRQQVERRRLRSFALLIECCAPYGSTAGQGHSALGYVSSGLSRCPHPAGNQSL
jgi:hypothetical protein